MAASTGLWANPSDSISTAQKMRTNRSIVFIFLLIAHLFTARRTPLFAANQTWEGLYRVLKKEQLLFPRLFILANSNLGDETMPAKSKAQQKAAGAALAAKRGEIKKSSLQGASKEMAKSMTKKELEDLASTSHKGLPEHVEPKE